MNRKGPNMRGMLHNARYYMLIAMLAAGITLVYWPSRASTEDGAIDLSGFPVKIGEWTGEDRRLSDKMLKTLGATAYLMREYRNGDRTMTLYITYFDTGHGGLTHNPEKCYTASGWTFLGRRTIEVAGSGRLVLQSTIVRGDRRQVVLYWYQERSRIIVSKWRHVATVLSRALTGRETHSLVASVSREITGSGDMELTVEEMGFVRQVTDALAEQIPS